jgi:hypothetical protein
MHLLDALQSICAPKSCAGVAFSYVDYFAPPLFRTTLKLTCSGHRLEQSKCVSFAK